MTPQLATIIILALGMAFFAVTTFVELARCHRAEEQIDELHRQMDGEERP